MSVVRRQIVKHDRYEVRPLATITVAAVATVIVVVTVVVIVATDDLRRITLRRCDFYICAALMPNCNYYMPGTNICP